MRKIAVRHIYYHALAWTAFIAYEISYLYVVVGSLGNLWDYASHYLLNILLFYTNFYLITKVPYARKLRGLLLLIVCELVVYLLFEAGLTKLLVIESIYKPSSVPALKVFLSQAIYRGFYFIAFSTAYWFIKNTMSQRRQIMDLENGKLRSEFRRIELEKDLITSRNLHLQSQLNPHLMFNTLNFIYNSVRKVSEETSQAILLLSDMMRYALTNKTIDGKVLLKTEITQITNLIRLNQIRFGNQLNVIFEVELSDENDYIIPLVLITFIENIFKHGNLKDPSIPASILLHCKDGHMKFRCSNLVNTSGYKESQGIGIENAKKRLELNYPGNHLLICEASDDIYMVRLDIELKKSELHPVAVAYES
ncbi:MAG: sensor histidine kinase [Mucilaginibacter sp.]